VTLETFLPFDLGATFSSAIALLIAAAVDPTLLLAHSPWSQRVYAILDEMDTRGNSIAGMTLSELKTLDILLNRLSPDWEVTVPRPSSDKVSFQMINMCITRDIDTESWDTDLKREFGLCGGLNAEQLMHVANSLDQDSWECLLSDLADSPALPTR
jgi:proline utilization trans-activator